MDEPNQKPNRAYISWIRIASILLLGVVLGAVVMFASQEPKPEWNVISYDIVAVSVSRDFGDIQNVAKEIKEKGVKGLSIRSPKDWLILSNTTLITNPGIPAVVQFDTGQKLFRLDVVPTLKEDRIDTALTAYRPNKKSQHRFELQNGGTRLIKLPQSQWHDRQTYALITVRASGDIASVIKRRVAKPVTAPKQKSS